jgi:hypothetical protein
MSLLAKAMAHIEGFGANPLNRPTRNNNPGDLEYHGWEDKYGAVLETLPPGRIPRFAKFPTVEAGFAAMDALLLSHYGDKTVAQLVTAYAPPGENPTASYIAQVCKLASCTPDTLVKTLLGS